MKRLFLLILGIGAMAAASFGATLSFMLDPIDGYLQGGAGTIVGWGYTLTNSDADEVTIEYFVFGESVPIGVFSTPGIPLSAVSAGAPLVVPFVAGFSGLQYDIDAGAALNAATLGLMTLVYDVYDPGTTDTTYGLTFNAADAGLDVTAQVFVNAEAPPGVPEPAAIALVGSGLAALLVLRRRCLPLKTRRGSS